MQIHSFLLTAYRTFSQKEISDKQKLAKMGIIIKPIVTEKLTAQGEKLNRYGFIVDAKANKLQIKEAVEKMYNVSVAEVNTANYNGKRKSRYTKAGLLSGRTNHFKKAYITLAGEDKIDFYANI